MDKSIQNKSLPAAPRRRRVQRSPGIREDEKLLDTHDVATLLKIKKQVVLDLVKGNKIPVIKLNSRVFRFRKEDVMRWLAGRTIIPHRTPLSLVRKGR